MQNKNNMKNKILLGFTMLDLIETALLIVILVLTIKGAA